MDSESLTALRAALQEMFACEARFHQAIARHRVVQCQTDGGPLDNVRLALDLVASACTQLRAARGEVLAYLVTDGQNPEQFALQRLAEDFTGSQLVALSQDPNGGDAHRAHLMLWETRRDLLMRHVTDAVALVCRGL